MQEGVAADQHVRLFNVLGSMNAFTRCTLGVARTSGTKAVTRSVCLFFCIDDVGLLQHRISSMQQSLNTGLEMLWDASWALAAMIYWREQKGFYNSDFMMRVHVIMTAAHRSVMRVLEINSTATHSIKEWLLSGTTLMYLCTPVRKTQVCAVWSMEHQISLEHATNKRLHCNQSLVPAIGLESR